VLHNAISFITSEIYIVRKCRLSLMCDREVYDGAGVCVVVVLWCVLFVMVHTTSCCTM